MFLPVKKGSLNASLFFNIRPCHAELISASGFLDPETILKQVQHKVQHNRFLSASNLFFHIFYKKKYLTFLIAYDTNSTMEFGKTNFTI